MLGSLGLTAVFKDPGVAISVYSKDEVMVGALEARADNYIAKPFVQGLQRQKPGGRILDEDSLFHQVARTGLRST